MITRVFLPRHGLEGSGDLLGWRVGDQWVCVAAVCPEGSIGDLRVYGHQSSSDLEIIGRCHTSPTQLNTAADSIQLVIDHRGRITSHNIRTSIILFSPPNTHRLRYLSLEPINLAALPSSTETVALSTKLSQMAEVWRDPSEVRRERDERLELVLGRINAVQEVQGGCRRLRGEEKVLAINGQGGKSREYSVVFGILESVANGLGNLVKIGRYPLFQSERGQVSLLTLSATCFQLCTRLEQLSNMPREWRATRRTDGGLHARNGAYIHFYNTVWLIANDIIVGMTISSLLREYVDIITSTISTITQIYAVDAVRAALAWLDDWPVGLKLNTPLSRLYCDLLGDMTGTWGSCMRHLQPTLPHLVLVTALFSNLGATFFTCLVSDLFHLITLHLRVAAMLVAQVYRWEMTSLYSLWNLFRGKRWNALRDRVDSFDYDLEQLFLGTLLFTISLFLLPTVLTYYFFFVMIRLIMLGFQATGETILALFNTFPLFAVMLRVKEPSRIPGGIRFVQRPFPGQGIPCLDLQSMPVSFDQIFARFGEAWRSLSAIYAPSRVAHRIARGRL